MPSQPTSRKCSRRRERQQRVGLNLRTDFKEEQNLRGDFKEEQRTHFKARNDGLFFWGCWLFPRPVPCQRHDYRFEMRALLSLKSGRCSLTVENFQTVPGRETKKQRRFLSPLLRIAKTLLHPMAEMQMCLYLFRYSSVQVSKSAQGYDALGINPEMLLQERYKSTTASHMALWPRQCIG